MFPAAAAAASAPVISEAFSSQVGLSAARLSARINPNSAATSYRVDYITEAAYQANLGAAKEGFTGALRSPSSTEASVGSGASPLLVSQQLFSLSPQTAYRYRFLAHNSQGTVETSPPLTFTTQAPGGGSLLADGRGWEMVSPVDKNGGQVDPPGAIAKGGVLQAASRGGAITYGSANSFAGGLGAPPASQYIATRNASGWSTQNITAPIFSGTYDLADQGVPYQLFSGDLSRALLLNGTHCRGGASGCAVANPPLGGSGAPAGYQDYYLRDDSSGGYEALLGVVEISGLELGPAHFDLRLAGASPDLGQVVISSCAALTPGANETPLGEGCDPAEQNLYKWSSGAGLALINGSTPGAALAAQSGAVSEDGSRIYFTREGKLYLREGATLHQVDEAQGGGGAFQAATSDGGIAFFTKVGHLYRYQAGGTATDLTPAGGVVGVLGTSTDGTYAYFQDVAGLKQWHAGTTTTVAPNQASPPLEASEPTDYPPTTGSARVSADGSKLLFVSSASLSGFDNTDLNSGKPDTEVYLYDATAPSLVCVSCNPTGERPIGSATIPGAITNGIEAASTDSYKPRVLSAGGRRVFFDSADALVLTDTNQNHLNGDGITDAYQWEAQGEGSCTKAGGCISLISSGRSAGGATFIDSSADGSDAFFITDDSLAGTDPGAVDLYDARIGGGFAGSSPPIPCEGDACQVLPSEPTDPTLDTLLTGRGNPAVKYHNLNHKKPKHHKKAKQTKHRRGRSR
jgi:hypothetical protein